ncbi:MULTISPECIES: GDSL-type esterase/lipase family protein [Blautia]|uniref:GDSL-type esterase/lipase family protein n=1 Tax=Blautia TaxID=572511 RepID=UPI000BA35A58|nr:MULTISPECIES: GDSL-type esterase/lipase family protein [Blautia]
MPIILAIIMTVTVLMAGYAILMGGTNIRFHSPAKEGQIKVACVGDSTTYGTVIPNVFHNCYPAQLGRMLGAGYHVENYGYNGKTALDLNNNSFRKTGEYPKSMEYQPDIVIIMLGTNDSKPQNWTNKRDYKEHCRTLIQSYQNVESRPAVYICTPNSAYYIQGKAEESYSYGINEKNLLQECEAIRELASEMELGFIDMYDVTSGHPEWYKFDGIHPNKDGANAIATAAYKAITVKSR